MGCGVVPTRRKATSGCRRAGSQPHPMLVALQEAKERETWQGREIKALKLMLKDLSGSISSLTNNRGLPPLPSDDGARCRLSALRLKKSVSTKKKQVEEI